MGIRCCKPFGLIRRYSSRLRQRKIVLLMVGLDKAGKSSIAKGLQKEPVENVLPTVGFDVIKLSFKSYNVIIYDLGGGPQIRDIWSRYFADVHGIIFVVDASDRDRLDECKKVFENLLVNESLVGKPVLLLANKQDKQGALDELDIVERLNVERLVNMQQCPTLVETCAAAAPLENGRKRALDPGIENGYRWLVRRIVADYESLNKRVVADQEIQKIAVKKEREAIRKKIEQQRESEPDDESTDHNEIIACPVITNPFQPIQVLVKEIEQRELNENNETQLSINTTNQLPLKQTTDEIIDLETFCNGKSVQNGNVKDQIRQKSSGQKKKRQLLKKTNRTAPVNECVSSTPSVSPPETKQTVSLPPIRHRPPLSWAQVSNGGKSPNGFAWELEKSLEVVPAAPYERQQTVSRGSDTDDVIIPLR